MEQWQGERYVMLAEMKILRRHVFRFESLLTIAQLSAELRAANREAKMTSANY